MMTDLPYLPSMSATADTLGQRVAKPAALGRLVGVVTSLALLLAGCSSPAQQSDVEVTHVHGLDYVDGRIYVATHHGLVVGAPGGKEWSWAYVGQERYDFMGFTTNGQTFYSSGHPDDPYEFGGTMLGLRRSMDQGQTWDQRSLKGQADFHALTVDAQSGDLLGYWRTVIRSTDGGLTWQNLTSPPAQVFALAAAPLKIWAGTSSGMYVSSDGMNWTTGSLSGAIASVSASKDGMQLLASQISNQGGATWKSADGGASWTQMGGHKLLEKPQAPILFAIDRADQSHIFAADAAGTIIESKDGGNSWDTLRG